MFLPPSQERTEEGLPYGVPLKPSKRGPLQKRNQPPNGFASKNRGVGGQEEQAPDKDEELFKVLRSQAENRSRWAGSGSLVRIKAVKGVSLTP